MAVPLHAQHDIREMDASCVPRTEIARMLGLSRNTVSKCPVKDDMPRAPPLPVSRPRPSLTDYET